MKATLDIPDDIASEVQRRAEMLGLQMDAQIVLLLRMGLIYGEIGGQLDVFLRAIAAARHRLRSATVHKSSNGDDPLNLQIDPITGLPVIISPPDAPVYSMDADAVLAMEQAALAEEDLERAGISVRH